jgi:hypothetical protein
VLAGFSETRIAGGDVRVQAGCATSNDQTSSHVGTLRWKSSISLVISS